MKGDSCPECITDDGATQTISSTVSSRSKFSMREMGSYFQDLSRFRITSISADPSLASRTPLLLTKVLKARTVFALSMVY
jgi:hypothetical protein